MNYWYLCAMVVAVPLTVAGVILAHVVIDAARGHKGSKGD